MRLLLLGLLTSTALVAADPAPARRPNILFFFVDDLGRYASLYAKPGQPSLNDIVKTPNFDRIGREGVVFDHAFVHVSSCTPSRASLTTGRYFWNCGSGAFLQAYTSNWRDYPDPLPAMVKFPDLLRESGYYARKSIKTIPFKDSPVARQPATPIPNAPYQRYGLHVSEAKTPEDRARRIEETLAHPRLEMRRVLQTRAADQPFFFIYGTINVHRPYAVDSGSRLWGIQPDSLKGLLPKFLPDVDDTRRDFADYLGEVQAADAMLGVMIDELAAAGELDRTLIIVTGDNGLPGVPRGKTHCYDLSAAAPLMVRWPEKIPAARRVDDFVSVLDIGPTLLEMAGLPVPGAMVGRSFARQLTSPQSGWIDPQRDWVVIGRESHVSAARAGNLPYPMRAVRTKDYLYIRNFKPERTPSGDAYDLEQFTAFDDYTRNAEAPYRDMDASLTKAWLLRHRHDDGRASFELTLGLRPAEELYAVTTDPDSLHNLANDPAAASVKARLAAQLQQIMESSQDPRLTDAFDRPPYVDFTHASPDRKKAKKAKAK